MNAADRKLLARQAELSADFIVSALRKDRIKNVKIEWIKLHSDSRCVEMSIVGVWWKPVVQTLERLLHVSGSEAPFKQRDFRVMKTRTEGYCTLVPFEIRLPSISTTARVAFFSRSRGQPGTVIQFHP